MKAGLIRLTTSNGQPLMVRVETISVIRKPAIYEAKGFAALGLMNGQTFIVRETMEDVAELIGAAVD